MTDIAQRYNVPYTTAFDTTGIVAPGAKLYFYQTGTDTPANTYSNAGLTIANANPVVANSAGLFGSIFLALNQEYKVVLKDSNDDEIWTADPVYGPGINTVRTVDSIASLKALAAQSGGVAEVLNYYAGVPGGGGIFYWNASSTATPNDGTIVQATGVVTGRWLRQIDPGTVLALDFGCKFDNSNDDTTYLQAAIDYAGTTGIQRVIIPSGVAKITSTINIYYPIILQGSGIQTTTLMATGFAADAVLLNLDGTVHPNAGVRIEGLELRDFTIRSNNGVAQGCTWNNVANSGVYRVGLYALHKGIVITGTQCFSNYFDQLLTLSTVTRTISFESFTGGGQFTFAGCNFGGTIGCNVDNASLISGITFLSSNFEGCTQQGLFVAGTVNGICFSGCRFEANGTGDIVLRPNTNANFCMGLSVSGCFFDGDGVSTAAIALGGDTGFVGGFNISGNFCYTYSSYFVHLNGGGDFGVVSGNIVDGVPATISGLRPGVLAVNNAIYVESPDAFTSDTAEWNPPLVAPSITGALSAVTDAAAKDVLTSIVDAGVAIGLWTDGTT